ncbi:MAG: hypothetical protein M1836_006753 [Candelina mexicana]|nr:MAG: hypothetical protein M1836_006753 [Candelina mexicana]
MAAPKDAKNMSPEEWESPEVKDTIYHLVCVKNLRYSTVVAKLIELGYKATEWKLKDCLRDWKFKKGVSWDNYPYEETSESVNSLWFAHPESSSSPSEMLIRPNLKTVSDRGAQASPFEQRSSTALPTSQDGAGTQAQIPIDRQENFLTNAAHNAYPTTFDVGRSHYQESLNNYARVATDPRGYIDDPEFAGVPDSSISYSSNSLNTARSVRLTPQPSSQLPEPSATNDSSEHPSYHSK